MGLGSIVIFMLKEGVNFLLSLTNDLFDFFGIFLRVVFEGRADSAGNHTF
jgi:hypothetical protein